MEKELPKEEGEEKEFPKEEDGPEKEFPKEEGEEKVLPPKVEGAEKEEDACPKLLEVMSGRLATGRLRLICGAAWTAAAIRARSSLGQVMLGRGTARD